MTQEISSSSRPGRPRSEATRLAILNATADLMLESGFSGTTIEAIAARARVSKVTIYKWWPSRGAVAIDAYFHRFRETSVFPDTGDVVRDITVQILSVIETFRGRAGYVMAELLGHAQSDPALAEMLRIRWLQPRREAATVVLQRAINRGEIRSDVSLPVLMDELYGPVYYRLIARHEPLSDEFAHELVANTLRGVRPD
ncbi:MAG: TetR/AcrR family transcriptional regulator [Acidimicrobiales bacterium]